VLNFYAPELVGHRAEAHRRNALKSGLLGAVVAVQQEL